MWSLLLMAAPLKDRDAAEAALKQIDRRIAEAQQKGDLEQEGEARWQKIVTLKNFSLTERQAAEATSQMEWFERQDQWDYYYHAWQLKANALSALGKLQQALQETQRMLSDAKQRDNRLGRAMAYKQIGIIYLNMKQTQPAIEALQHYADLMKDEQDDISSISNIYYRMAKAYDYDKAYDKELQVGNEWLHFLHEHTDKDADEEELRECYNTCYLWRAAAYIGLRQLGNARLALDSASRYAHLGNTALGRHHYYKMMARYYMAQGNAAKTLLYADSVSITTHEKDDHTQELRAQALMLQDKGMEAARIYQRLYHDRDSIFGRETRQHLDELNTLFQVDEMKAEQQRTKLRYTLTASAAVVLALLVLLLYGWRAAIRQKRANEQLRLANERALASSKMKTEFIRNISHEIRTPLNIVSGFTQILTTPGMELPAEEVASIGVRVSENADRITKLVERLLELSDASSEAVIECNDLMDIRELVDEAIGHAGITHLTRPGNPKASVAFECLELPPVTIRTNKMYAVRILAQLLENAVKFTHEGSVTLSTVSTDLGVSFIVDDTGIGIPTDQSEHIFEKFVQLDEFAEGTGIGLTVARSLARRMGGDLWLDTTYTQGARFVFEMKNEEFAAALE